MNFLLPSQTLLDLCEDEEIVNAAKTWARGIDTGLLRVSVISIAQAHASVMQVEDATERSRLEADLSTLLAQIEGDTAPPLDFDSNHAAVWQALMYDESLKGLGQTDRQVYATAMYEGLTVVEANGNYTQALQDLGVSLHLI